MCDERQMLSAAQINASNLDPFDQPSQFNRYYFARYVRGPDLQRPKGGPTNSPRPLIWSSVQTHVHRALDHVPMSMDGGISDRSDLGNSET